MSYIIGIDLGTSTTEAAIYRNGKPELILNFLQQPVTPSAVGIDENGNWIVGERARAQYLLYPEKTAIEVKRGIGTDHMFPIGKQRFTAVELSSRILEHVYTYASDFLGEPVDRAVISVPAYFNDIQRRETVMAGHAAGFQVERIINEPTAAALSYGLLHMDEESHILVYDLGGGTFDITLLEMFDGVLEVKASSGDNKLGGKDFDECLINHFCEEFRKQHRIDPASDAHAMVRLKSEAESCKKALSESDSYRVILPALMKKNNDPIGLDITVTRDRFEEMTSHLLERTHHPIDTVLSDAGLSPFEIDKVILVGGSTRMPMVVKDLEAYLNIPVSTAVNPDFAVAEGAAIQAAIIAGDISPDEGLIMTDVNPYTLGVRVFDGMTSDKMSVIIPRNVTIPVVREQIYSTSFDYQTVAKIEVFQGESERVSSNHFLGDFSISGIPPKKAAKEQICVNFSYDLNGILSVTATIVSTGGQASIEIDMTDSDETDIPEIDVESWKEAPGASKYRSIIRKAERMLKKIDSDSDTVGYKTLSDGLLVLKKAIILENDSIADKCEETLTAAIRLLEKS